MTKSKKNTKKLKKRKSRINDSLNKDCNHLNIEAVHEPIQIDDGKFGSDFFGVAFFLIISGMMGIWIMQNSVNAYYLQTYHHESPISQIKSPVWRAGANIANKLYGYHDNITHNISAFNQQYIDSHNAKYLPNESQITTNHLISQDNKTPNPPALQEFKGASLAMEQEIAYVNQPINQTPSEPTKALIENQLTINKHQKVFFAGDSMMQGIAPHIQKHLQNLGIKSINLSKQSTGLSYPKFFDWNKTIKKTINGDSSIKILVIMLGPNDPWAMSGKNGQYLKFKTKEWDSEYQARMSDIIEFAKSKNVGIIWITPPNMKKDKLNHQMNHLNDVMMAELKRHDIKIIDSRPIMGGRNNHYYDYLNKDGKQIKMRTTDGIHFSHEGQKILAKEVQSHLIIEGV